MSVRHENVKWVDGLRGIASVLVVFTHIARGFDDELFSPASAPGAPPRLFQYPVLRILVQGRIGVAIFSFVTGYVCALKPIRQYAAGNHGAAFSGIAKSAFRRIPRLVLPATLATILTWFVCQFGAFNIAKKTDNWWLNWTSPNMIPYVGPAIYDLLLNIIRTWTRNFNAFDRNQWSLMFLLKGAFQVYTLLFATAYVKPRYRMMISMALYWYYYISSDAVWGTQFFFGTFISDLSQYAPHVAWMNARKRPSRFLSPIFIMLGLYFASYPEAHADWSPWSTFMGQKSVYIFPKDCDTPRFYTAIGLQCLVLGIHFSNPVKNILSNQYLLWFGKNSFAVYLLHGTLLRTLLCWMLLGMSVPADILNKDGQTVPGPPLRITSPLRCFFWIPIWFVVLYYIANLWTKHVDPLCARMTQKLENFVFEQEDLPEKSVLPV